MAQVKIYEIVYLNILKKSFPHHIYFDHFFPDWKMFLIQPFYSYIFLSITQESSYAQKVFSLTSWLEKVHAPPLQIIFISLFSQVLSDLLSLRVFFRHFLSECLYLFMFENDYFRSC